MSKQIARVLSDLLIKKKHTSNRLEAKIEYHPNPSVPGKHIHVTMSYNVTIIPIICLYSMVKSLAILWHLKFIKNLKANHFPSTSQLQTSDTSPSLLQAVQVRSAAASAKASSARRCHAAGRLELPLRSAMEGESQRPDNSLRSWDRCGFHMVFIWSPWIFCCLMILDDWFMIDGYLMAIDDTCFLLRTSRIRFQGFHSWVGQWAGSICCLQGWCFPSSAGRESAAKILVHLGMGNTDSCTAAIRASQRACNKMLALSARGLTRSYQFLSG